MNREKQKGNILVTSLLLMVTMNLMGTGLIYKSARESNSATFKTVDATVLQITDSCTHDVITYFETLETTPSTIDNDQFDVTSLTHMMDGSESTMMQNKLANYSYECDVTFIISKSESSGSSTGVDISSTGSEYGGSGGKTLKDYYQIVSTGSGPKSASKVVNTLISVEY